MPNTDPAIIQRTADCLQRFGFQFVIEDRRLRTRLRDGPPAGRDGRAVAVLPDGRPGDPAQVLARGPRDQVRRPPAGREIEPLGRGDADVRHHDRHRRLHRQRRGQPQLLRAADARVPGPGRGAGLRARDRGEGQRARGAAGGAGEAVVEGRDGRAGHEHGPVPVGGGPLQAHARHLGGVPGLPEPVLDPDQVAAAAAGSGPAEGDRGRSRT